MLRKSESLFCFFSTISGLGIDAITCLFRTAREAMAARFPKADLSSRKDFLNQSIDRILSES